MMYVMNRMTEFDLCITEFDSNRDVQRVYEQPRQLILKNFQIPDGVTIIGTEESIKRFMDAAMPDTTSYIVGAGFYPWSVR